MKALCAKASADDGREAYAYDCSGETTVQQYVCFRDGKRELRSFRLRFFFQFSWILLQFFLAIRLLLLLDLVNTSNWRDYELTLSPETSQS